ncbi:MAK10-like protein [Tanacetum coccineum]
MCTSSIRTPSGWLAKRICSFHGLRSEDPNQHLKDFLKLVDSLDLDGENKERTCLRLFQFSLCNQASNWLERLPAGSISTWEVLTTRFLTQFFPPRRTAKLRNDILMFQQHHGESLSEEWTHFKDLLQKVPHHGIDLWLQAILEDLALYDNESWNNPRDFAKPVKAIALPQDVPSTSDRRLIDLETHVQRLMEAHLAPTQHTQVNKITTLCEICSGPHDTQICIENPEQAFVEYASSRTDEAGAITDRIAGTLPSDTVKNPKLGTHLVSSARSYPISGPQYPSQPSTSINAIKAHLNDTITMPQQLEEIEPTLEDEFQNLHLNLLVLEVLAYASIYNAILDKYVKSLELGEGGSAFVQVGIVKDIEIHIGKLKLLNDFYVLEMKKDLKTHLLVGRGFLATANAVIDCRMAKIVVGEGITRSIFGVKGVDSGVDEAPYWTTLGKRESYKPRPSTDGIGAKPPYYVRKDFLDCRLLEE